MKALQAVQKIAGSINKSMYQLSLDLGKKGQYMGSLINRDSTPSASNLAKMLEACGYVLCAVPSYDVPKNAIIIDENDKDNSLIMFSGSRYTVSNLFDWEISDKTLNQNESLYRIYTGNDSDSLYFTASNGVPESELTEHAKREMTRHFGKNGPSRIISVERVPIYDELIG